MSGATEALETDLLDLLVEGPSPFGGLYATLIRHCGHLTDCTGDCLRVLERMKRNGWVSVQKMTDDGYRTPTDSEWMAAVDAYAAWLPTASFDSLAVDEVGLVFEIQPAGIAEWKARGRADPDYAESWWKIDQDCENLEIVISAASLAVADEALNQWLADNRNASVVSASRHVESALEHHLGDGTVLPDGVRVTLAYRRAE